MAKKRLQFDGNFEAEIYRTVSGVEGVGRRFRTRRTTLVDVADDIIKEAKRIVDMPARRRGFEDKGGLPSKVAGGGRNISYPFARSNTGPTYRSSFRSKVEKRNGRLVIVVNNDHPWAGDVEYGTRRYGDRIFVKRARYLKIPITDIRAKKADKSRNLSLSERKKRGWASARDDYRAEYRKIYKKNRKSIAGLTPAQAGQYFSRPKRTFSKSFVMRDEIGRPWLFTRSVRTRNGYKILRRAMRNVARKKFG